MAGLNGVDLGVVVASLCLVGVALGLDIVGVGLLGAVFGAVVVGLGGIVVGSTAVILGLDFGLGGWQEGASLRMLRFSAAVGAMRILAEMGRRRPSAARRTTGFLTAWRATRFLGGKEDDKLLGVEE